MVSFQRTSTMTSTTPLTHKCNQPQKNFSAAFANLQSQYGFSGGMTVPTPVRETPYSNPPPKARKHLSTSPTPTPSSQSKNYELAFGNLASSYGFHGGVPTPVLKSEKSTTTKPSLASRGKPSTSSLSLDLDTSIDSSTQSSPSARSEWN